MHSRTRTVLCTVHTVGVLVKRASSKIFRESEWGEKRSVASYFSHKRFINNK